VLDTSGVAPTANRHLKQSAVTIGAVTHATDTREFARYRGRPNESRWCFAPKVLECFGMHDVANSSCRLQAQA
jgi:hypothetical protein